MKPVPLLPKLFSIFAHGPFIPVRSQFALENLFRPLLARIHLQRGSKRAFLYIGENKGVSEGVLSVQSGYCLSALAYLNSRFLI